VRAGANAFAEHCVRCHGARAQGEVGPNLTDEYWIAGGGPLAIYRSIVDGRATHGMPAWGAELGPARCKQLTAYLLTLRGSRQPGKPPQGERWEPAAADAPRKEPAWP
jgi:cytochrome c oxidase cbb3-type subunit III